MFALLTSGFLAAACLLVAGVCWGEKSSRPGAVFCTAVGLLFTVVFAFAGYRLGEGTAKNSAQTLSNGIYAVESVTGYNGAVNALLAECEVGPGEMKKSDELIYFSAKDAEIKRTLVVGEYVQVDGDTLQPFAFPRPLAATAPTPQPPEKQ